MYDKDLEFVQAVEASSAYDYLGKTDDTSHILTEKIDLLYQKGYRNLWAQGSKMPIEKCSPWKISTVLKDTYERTLRKVQDYNDNKVPQSNDGKLEEKIWQDEKNNVTFDQHLLALDGYWGQIRMAHGKKVMQEQMQLELELYHNV